MARKKIIRKASSKGSGSNPELVEAEVKKAAAKPVERKSKAAAAAITRKIAEEEQAKVEAAMVQADESHVYFWRCRNGSPQHIGAFFTKPVTPGNVPILGVNDWYTSYKDPDQDWPMTKQTITCQVCKKPLPVFTNRDGSLIPRSRFVSSMTRERFEALTADVKG